MSKLELLPCPVCNNELYCYRKPNLMWSIYCHNGCFETSEYFILKDVVDMANAFPRSLVWTTEPPKIPGWYWFKEYIPEEDYPYYNCEKVFWINENACEEYDNIFRLTTLRHKFAGPIPMPKENND